MPYRFIIALVLGVTIQGIEAQERKPANINDLQSPKEIVEKLWNMAMRGDFLTESGRTRASQFFTQPTSHPAGSKVFVVMSNEYAVVRTSVEGKSAKVWMEYTKLGEIDSDLRFTSAPATNAYGTAEEYHLMSGPRHLVLYGSDRRTKLQEKEISESVIWQIEGSQAPPWTTVNTAIRYVLEQKMKTANSILQNNAERTLIKLLSLH
jgi:hypothetical protein